MTSKSRLLATASAVAIAAVLSGCAGSEYLERRDTITIGAGDAAARNRAIQTINPRPRHAYGRWHATDGHRMNNAIEQYRAPANSGDGEGETDTRNNNANQDPTGLSPQ